jgi:hypothetical protein
MTHIESKYQNDRSLSLPAISVNVNGLNYPIKTEIDRMDFKKSQSSYILNMKA